jgi:hypothetical protein
MNLFAPSVEEELKCSRRERILAARRVRRVAYENRQSFQIGLNSRTKEPVIYAPTPEGAWKTNDGYQATHEALGKYLRQYGFSASRIALILWKPYRVAQLPRIQRKEHPMSTTYTVYHRWPLWAGMIQDHLPTPVDLDWPAAYIPVAQVEVQDPIENQPELPLEEVYQLTQHLDTEWWHNPGVTALVHTRSTSVGDVLGDSQTLWVVAPMGLVKLDARLVTNVSLLEARIRPQTIQLSISANVSEITVWVGSLTHPLTAPVTKPIVQSGGLQSNLEKALEAACAEIMAALIMQKTSL